MKSNKASINKLTKLFDKELKSRLLNELKIVRLGKISPVQTTVI